MDKHLKKLTKKRRAGEWNLDSFQPLCLEAASIYDRICPTHGMPVNDNFTAFKKALEAVADGLPHESAVFVEALEKLPGIVERIKALPKSEVRELRMVQEFEVKALNAFIEACKLGVSWVFACQILTLLNSGTTDYEVIASKVGCSREWVEVVVKRSKRGNVDPGLEGAIAFRFTQAYKWWKAEIKAEDAFLDYFFQEIS